MKWKPLGASFALLLAVSTVGMPATTGAKKAPKCDGLRATIVGTNGDDNIRGTAGPDVIVTKGGSDHVRARGDDDTICTAGGVRKDISAGSGDDTILPQSDNAVTAVFLNGGSGDDALFSSEGPGSYSGGSGDDTAGGGGGADNMNAGSGDDFFIGGEGNDSIGGGDGTDRCWGEGGTGDINNGGCEEATGFP